MQVTEMKWWNGHWLQRQAGTGLKGAYQTKVTRRISINIRT